MKWVGVGYVSDTCNQFKHMDISNFMVFQEKEASISDKSNISSLSHGWEIEVPYFSLI